MICGIIERHIAWEQKCVHLIFVHTVSLKCSKRPHLHRTDVRQIIKYSNLILLRKIFCLLKIWGHKYIMPFSSWTRTETTNLCLGKQTSNWLMVRKFRSVFSVTICTTCTRNFKLRTKRVKIGRSIFCRLRPKHNYTPRPFHRAQPLPVYLSQEHVASYQTLKLLINP